MPARTVVAPVWRIEGAQLETGFQVEPQDRETVRGPTLKEVAPLCGEDFV